VLALFLAGIVAVWGMILPQDAAAVDEKWKAEMIADALLAGPPSVTRNASIFAWNSEGDLILLRPGTGPYTCLASGFSTLRLGKPRLPHPDPMCLDENAWAFMQAVIAEKNPRKPEKPYPTAPGMGWMLAGMNVKKGAVAAIPMAGSILEKSAQIEGEMVRMTPHIMIMPVPFNKNSAKLSTKYSIEESLDAWIMAADSPIEHLMVHFSWEDTKAMMEAGE
jgi:hypothetical protein